MRQILYAMVGVGLFTLLLGQQSALGGPAEQALQASLDVQQRWLGSGAVGNGWDNALMTPQLQEQLARGQAADRRAVAEILAKYQSNTPGLERKQFVATRRALEAWLNSLPAYSAEEFPKAIEDAKANYNVPRPEYLSSAKARLQQAVARLDAFLARGGRERQAGWQKYLDLEQLQAELARAETPDPRALQAIEARFFQNEVGLELPPFLNTRLALRDYTNSVLAVSDKDPQAAYASQLDQLAKLLAGYPEAQRDVDAIAIGQSLGYLSSVGQADPLVKAVRQQYSQPNLFVTASQRLAGAGVNRAVNDVSPIRENILGTDIRGTAHTVGNVSLRTVPSAQRAILELVMTGYATSRNVGRNGPATIYTNGYTSLSASKRLFFDANGLQQSPAVGVANTDTQITGISAKHRIVERIATKRAGQQVGQAEVIASQRAERRLERRVDEQAAVDLARANTEYQNRFRQPLLRKDEFPPVLNFATTADSVRVTALHAGRYRLGAPSAPPKLTDRHDLAVRVHESLVGNAGETGLGGRTLTDERLAEILKEATGEVPEELQITEDKDPWSITFSEDRPFAVIFDNQTATIAIHGRRFTRGEREIRKDMVISAKYRLEQQGNGSKLTREGDVMADYVGNAGSLSVSDVAFKTFMRKKFSALFKPEMESQGLKLPGRWASVGPLSLRRMESDNGWLTLSWDQPDPRALTTAVVGAE